MQTRLLGLSLEMSPEMDVQEFEARGIKFPTGHALTREWSTGTAEGGFSFNEMPFIFDGALRKPTVVAIADPAGSATVWAASTPYTLGQYVRPTTANGHIYEVTVAGTSAAAEPVWPTGAGATVMDNDVEFTEAGDDTNDGNIAERLTYDINDVGKDDIQTYIIEQGDKASGRGRSTTYAHVTGFNISSERSGEMEVSADLLARALDAATLTEAGITEARTIYGTPEMVEVYCDDSAAALGTTKLRNATAEFELSDRFNQAWFHDRAIRGFVEHVEQRASLELTLTIGEGPKLDEFVDGLRRGQRKFVRFDVLGPEIVPGSGVHYSMRWDVACQVSDSYSLDDEDGVYMAELTLAAERDATWGKTTALELVRAVNGGAQ